MQVLGKLLLDFQGKQYLRNNVDNTGQIVFTLNYQVYRRIYIKKYIY